MTAAQTTLSTQGFPSSYEKAIVALMTRAAGRQRSAKAVRFVSQPFARALKDCGTAHIYTDTADQEELSDLLVQQEDATHRYLYGEVDGNTTNQPLVIKVLDDFLTGDDTDNLVSWVKVLQQEKPDLSIVEAAVVIYSIINGRLGLEVLNTYAAGRTWQISLELHTALAPDPVASQYVARCLNRAVPHAFVKVAFTPDLPHSLLIARDLEQQGIAVNFTATFSARQIVAAALLANPHRTNIFLGRLNQGLSGELLGEHVMLETQRHVYRLRRDYGVRTLNMLASARRWQTLVLTAGCDVYTVPYSVLKDFFKQTEVGSQDITSCLEVDYRDRLGIADAVVQRLGQEKIQRLYWVEPEFIEFLVALRQSAEYATIDGEGLYKRFDEAGFGDFFYAPSAMEWQDLRQGKLPNFDSALTDRLPLDTLYSLLAVGDFTNFQDQMDEKISAPLQHLFAR